MPDDGRCDGQQNEDYLAVCLPSIAAKKCSSYEENGFQLNLLDGRSDREIVGTPTTEHGQGKDLSITRTAQPSFCLPTSHHMMTIS
ncbi:hypothetical protein DAPPUDRAFT_249121 [Daphnia pulex]|uniref:Uncharacterized protein n=1 Tax=Daphnia pulex TaxID=6669 RepID=E9GVW9_DAPPU|nr:hypothetical protein DAPPUDRAFT_249121 [Daphnia pulex]|eukprot:EFX76252.1 hypothetical protein DAPPUDRAFT_249121 [Daphnia pulex]